MQNFVMADVDGAIAYKAAGRVPLRRADNDIMGQAPAPGWEPRYDWDGWIAAADTPEDDGAKGWIATANQKITPAGYKYFLGQDYALPHRFDRIETLLAATPKHDAASMRQIHADQISTATQRLLPVLQKAQTSHPLGATALAQLKGFDAVMRADAAAPLIFAAWADEMARGLVEPKVGAAGFKSLYGKRHFRFTVEEALLGPDPWWCAPKTCDEQVNAALERALNRLQASYGPDIAQWQWGRAHVARSEHRPFSMVAPLNKHFEVRTPTGGDGFTVNVGQYWLHEEKTPFANRHAASMRTVFDLSNLENSQFIYQTGQSGLVFSSRYQDMAQAWADVRYRPLQLAPATIEHAVTLTP
jgi:penicillin amidase